MPWRDFAGECDSREEGKVNDNLQQQIAIIFKAWFVDFVPFDETMPSNWTVSTLGDVTEMGAGGDKPKETSQVKTPLYPYPIYSNGIRGCPACFLILKGVVISSHETNRFS